MSADHVSDLLDNYLVINMVSCNAQLRNTIIIMEFKDDCLRNV